MVHEFLVVLYGNKPHDDVFSLFRKQLASRCFFWNATRADSLSIPTAPEPLAEAGPRSFHFSGLSEHYILLSKCRWLVYSAVFIYFISVLFLPCFLPCCGKTFRLYPSRAICNTSGFCGTLANLSDLRRSENSISLPHDQPKQPKL